MAAPIPTKPSTRPAPAAGPAIPRPPSRKKTQVLSSKLVFKGKVFSVHRDQVIEPTGVRNTREIIRHNGSIVILAVDEHTNPEDPIIIMERQYRHAAGQFLLELPAGHIEPGEAPLAAAKRELIEETGYRARRWSKFTRYYASPGFLGEFMQVFLARDLRTGVAEPEPDEQIDLHRIPLSELVALIHQGKILDGKTIIAVLLYQSQRLN